MNSNYSDSNLGNYDPSLVPAISSEVSFFCVLSGFVI